MSVHAMTAARRATTAGALVALVIGALVGPAGPAAAHDELISTQPSADAVLDTAPTSIALEFSQDVLAISPTIVLTGPAGQVDLAAPTVDATRVSVPVPADLPPGAYSVIWRIVSVDGHPVQGTFGFTLTGPVTTSTPTDTPTTLATPTPTAGDATPSPTARSGAGTSGVSGLTVTVIAALLALALATAVAVTRARHRR